jgi:outer membrane protein assembly factor BamB
MAGKFFGTGLVCIAWLIFARGPVAAAFLPDRLGGLTLWLDAAAPGTLTLTSAGTVYAWSDRRGGSDALVQSAPGARPLYVAHGIGGLSNVFFNGSSAYLISTDAAFSRRVYPESTLFVVQKGTPDSDTAATIWSGGDAGGYPRWGFGLPSAGWATFFFGPANGRLFYPASIDVRRPAIFAAGASVTQQTAFANYDGMPQTALAGGLSGDPGAWPLTLGARYEPSTARASAFNRSQLAEVLVYRRLLAPAETAEVEGYLACKWGLQATLPALHPYRNLCPGVVPLASAPATLNFGALPAAPQRVTVSGGTPPYSASGCAAAVATAWTANVLTVAPETATSGCILTIADAGSPRQLAEVAVTAGGAARVSVTTYHDDNLRTGWNAAETALTPATVGGGTFGPLHSIALDDQVDAQPLLVTAQPVAGGPQPSVHDVVYVATESNTIFALDAQTGALLLSRNLGPPVSQESLPGECGNNGPNVGITSTPVFDAATDTLYAMAYTADAGGPAYRLHALDASTLADRLPPAVVAASRTLADGTVYAFSAAESRQRPALLESNGTVYAGFGSFCDHHAALSRGWLLGWRANSLTPLPNAQLDDRETNAPDRFYLASIWMSGSGPAADAAGNVYVATGNSDPSGTTYDGVSSVQESVVKLAPDLSRVVDLFTPQNVGWLDVRDDDFGSGGVLLLPDQPGAAPHLAFAAGKHGVLYALDRDRLGGYVAAGPDAALAEAYVGPCWCASSYFTGSDGVGRVVTGGNGQIAEWSVATAPFALQRIFRTPPLPGNQDPGAFTSVSSNGTQPGSAVIWSVSRPADAAPASINLYAFDAASGAQLYAAAAGSWPSSGANANIVPVVANGRVYVASYKQLAIFGLGAPAAHLAALPRPARFEATRTHTLTGTIASLHGTRARLRTRAGRFAEIDLSEAARRGESALLGIGRAIVVRGAYVSGGAFRARSIERAKPSPALWPPDR